MERPNGAGHRNRRVRRRRAGGRSAGAGRDRGRRGSRFGGRATARDAGHWASRRAGPRKHQRAGPGAAGDQRIRGGHRLPSRRSGNCRGRQPLAAVDLRIEHHGDLAGAGGEPSVAHGQARGGRLQRQGVRQPATPPLHGGDAPLRDLSLRRIKGMYRCAGPLLRGHLPHAGGGYPLRQHLRAGGPELVAAHPRHHPVSAQRVGSHHPKRRYARARLHLPGRRGRRLPARRRAPARRRR